jgi:hypothetical protein
VFECRLLVPLLQQTQPLPYDQLAQRFGFLSPLQAANALTTGKRMFARLLRAVVGEYVPQDEVEAEIGELKQSLSRGA